MGAVSTIPGSQLCPREGLAQPPGSVVWEHLLVLAGVIDALGDTRETEMSETLAQMGGTLMNDKDVGCPPGSPRVGDRVPGVNGAGGIPKDSWQGQEDLRGVQREEGGVERGCLTPVRMGDP